jgi:hypothetical protein
MPEHDHDHDDDHDHDADHDHDVVERERVVERPVGTRTVATGPSGAGLAVRVVLTLAGAALMIVSAFLEWAGDSAGIDLGVDVLWTATPNTEPNFIESVGFVAIVLGLIAIVGLAPRTGVLTSLAGALGIVAFILFVVSIYRIEGDFGVQDVALGGWLLLAGGVVALIGGFFGARPTAVVTTTA